jgi:peptide/nickel transport system substrate-binding protein
MWQLAMNDMLVMIAPDNTYMPRLAESWDISADATTYTFHLRKGLKWSDGEPFSSKDVLFTFKLYMNPDSSNLVDTFAEVAGAADFKEHKTTSPEGLTAPDDNTFVMKLSGPDSEFLSTQVWPLLPIMPEHVLGTKNPKDLANDPWFRAPTTGMGPFKFVKWETDQFVEMERNPNYWKPVSIERMFFREADPNVAVAGMVAGDIDLMEPAASDIETLQTSGSVQIESAPDTGIIIIAPLMEKPPFDNVKVRQAFLYAMDRQGVVDTVFKGHASIVNTHMRIAKYLPTDLNPYAHDPAKAKQLLKEANWDPSYEWKIQWATGNKIREQIATILAANLQEVGVNAVLAPSEDGGFQETLTDRKGQGASFLGGGVYTVGAGAIETVLSCDRWWPKGENFSFYCNPEVDRLFKEAKATTDEAVKASNYGQIARITNEEINDFWITVQDTTYAHTTRLHGFKPTGSFTDFLSTIADWTLDPK